MAELIDKLEIAKLISRAKIGGTRVAFGGATVMTLYKGITLISLHGYKKKKKNPLIYDTIIQARTIKKYPSPMKLTTLTGVSGTIVATIVAAITDHKVSSWRLSWDMTFVAPLYNGTRSCNDISWVVCNYAGNGSREKEKLAELAISDQEKEQLVEPAISNQDHILIKTQN
ncbi:hypothetical protein GH714_017404 [Hevea brasiliensis]|uniref:Uncharacterized protein n=1 Tax=Hevea brasiliensis TaxID=3981 RepID=A0A6A6NCT8_HEVBR|nr:hypothetical protein GH714_017404 [Hevea brasiliensis]